MRTAFHLAGQDVVVIVMAAVIVHRNAPHLRSEITGVLFHIFLHEYRVLRFLDKKKID